MEIPFTGECFIPGKGSKICEEEHLERYRFASNYVCGKRILDIACGAGYGSNILLQANASFVLGCDISEVNIIYNISNNKHDNIEFKVKNIEKPILEGEFDVVVCFETIEHVNNFRSALDNLYVSLKKGGKIIISSPNRKVTNPYLGMDERASDYHVREFTMDEFRLHLTESHYKSIEIYGQRQQKYFDNPFLEKHYKRFFKPSKNSSPKVEKIREGLAPEYFVMVGTK